MLFRSNLKLLPAIGNGGALDATRSRTLKLTLLGNLPTPTVVPASTATATTSTSAVNVFSRFISFGARNNPDVIKLQKVLKAESLYSGPLSGNFLSLTQAALKKLQKKYRITQTGTIGPLTRKKLNEIANLKGIR